MWDNFINNDMRGAQVKSKNSKLNNKKSFNSEVRNFFNSQWIIIWIITAVIWWVLVGIILWAIGL